MIDPLELDAAQPAGRAGADGCGARRCAAHQQRSRRRAGGGTGAGRMAAGAVIARAGRAPAAAQPAHHVAGRSARPRAGAAGPGALADPRSATNGNTPAAALAELAEPERAALLARIETHGWDHAASAAIASSVAPSAGNAAAGEAGMVPKPIVLRMFLVHDGHAWHVMEGGLARVIEAGEHLAGALPTTACRTDVWVLNDERNEIIGPAMLAMAPLPIRRTTGDLPSRVADNLFWLGRYTERLEAAPRLVRAFLSDPDVGKRSVRDRTSRRITSAADRLGRGPGGLAARRPIAIARAALLRGDHPGSIPGTRQRRARHRVGDPRSPVARHLADA